MNFTGFKKKEVIGKCLQCSADVFGREGRKFCCDKCRYKHKNERAKGEKNENHRELTTIERLNMESIMPSKVNPSHYKGEIECIDAIRSSMTKEAFLGYLKGNILKYLWRYENKNGKEDLQKAEWYNQKLIQSL